MRSTVSEHPSGLVSFPEPRAPKNGNETSYLVMDLEIIDPHVHFWSPQIHPWLVEAAKKGGAPLGSFTAPEYSKDSR